MALDVTIPQIGESVATVFISRWIVQPGDYVAKGAPLVELDSDKASMEVPAPEGGVVVEHLVEEGDEIDVGAVVARLDTSAEAPADTAPAEPLAPEPKAAPAKDAPASKPAPKAAAASQPPAPTGGAAKAGPAARAAASEQGVALDGVAGTGRGGRVTTGDVSRHVAAGGTSAGGAAPAVPTQRVTRVKMSPLRRTIARRLVQAQHEAAMLTTFNEIDMSAAMAMRKRWQDAFVAKHGVKLGFMSIFAKAVIDALKAFPAVNAEIGDNEIVFKHYYNLAFAVSGPKGLVVPVLKDADTLSFAEVEKGISELAGRARDNKLLPSDFEDGTFTISNGGVFGSMMSTPILNPPQVGILGMHNIIERPVAVAGKVEIRPMMYVALSYDHRIIDGREAVGFLVRVKDCVENPERMLLEA